MKDWFSVDKEGLRALQKGKSKTFVINELVQNAWDENIKHCIVKMMYDDAKSKITISVEDDNPTGFADITHSYTLFADTYKRRDPTKRGRFNLGEKQVIAICDSAVVSTTKGTIIFDDSGRTEVPDEKRDAGSIITVTFDGTKKDFAELEQHIYKLLPPTDITFTVNGIAIKPKKVFRKVKAKLLTEVLKDDSMQRTQRNTMVHVVEHDADIKSHLYEMGIPIMPIETPWHLDVQQKIPLNADRESVRPAFVQDVYAEVLNEVHDVISDEQASDGWVREATKDDRIKKDAVETVLKKRFGDNICSKNPFDPNANDNAMANGYNVIGGSQMSKEEWDKIKEYGLIPSSSELFGTKGLKEAKPVPASGGLQSFGKFCQKCAREFQGNSINVKFVDTPGTNTRADYGGRTLRFNLALIPKSFFNKITSENINLLIHEIAHEKGQHTQESYHREITRLAGAFTMKALNDPGFFTLEET